MKLNRYAPERFLRRLAAVPEGAMRVALWRECFRALPPADSLAVVEAVLAALARRTPAAQVAFLALARCLQDDRSARSTLLAAAAVAGSAEVLGLLADDPPLRRVEADDLQAPALDNDREITLGERRAFARRPDRDLIDRLVFDPDPGVITNLLRNPRLVEDHVLRIASRRPNTAEILILVFQHPRWGRRRSVQMALVQNPYTPVEIAASLITLFERESLRLLAHDPGLHPLVRAQARARLVPVTADTRDEPG